MIPILEGQVMKRHFGFALIAIDGLGAAFWLVFCSLSHTPSCQNVRVPTPFFNADTPVSSLCHARRQPGKRGRGKGRRSHTHTRCSLLFSNLLILADLADGAYKREVWKAGKGVLQNSIPPPQFILPVPTIACANSRLSTFGL